MIIQNNNPYVSSSFTLQNRLLRLLWNIVWFVCIRPTPRALYPWRNFLMKLFGAKLGVHVHITGSTKIWAPWNLVVGDYVGIGENVNLYCMDKITIGNYAVISQGSHLCGGSHNYNLPNFQLITAPIYIGDRVWLCADSFIGLGVSIAEGSVIGARTVVVKPIIEPWAIWVGSPARKIGIRDKNAVLS